MRHTFVSFVAGLLFAGVVCAADTGRIVGRVVDDAQTGVFGVRVGLESAEPSAVTDGDGRFVLADVEAGSYTLVATLRDQRASRPDVEVVAGRNTEVEIEVDWPLTFADTVTVYSVSRNRERIVDAPSAVTTILPEEIERRSAHGQLPKLLEFTPGAELTQNGLFDFNLNVRGVNAALNRRVLVLIDGRDPSIPILGSQAWAAFSHPTSSIASLELVRGPASALYGADAYNGVLNMMTAEPRERPGGSVQIVAGELQTQRLDFSYSTGLGHDWYLRAVGGLYKSEDFAVSRTTTTEYSGLPPEVVPPPDNEDEIEYGGLRLDRYFGPQEKLLTLEAGVANFSGIVGVTTAGRIQLLDSRNPWARVNFNMPHWNFSTSYTGREARDQISLSSGAHSTVDSYRIDADVQGNTSFAGGKGRLVGGVQFRYTNADSADASGMQTVLYDKTTFDRRGLYGQLDYDINDKLKGVVAGRWDDSDLFDSRLSPKAALVYSPTPLHSLRLTYNQAFQSPNLAEFFVQFPVAAPLDLSALETALEMGGALGGVPLGFDSVPFLALGNRKLEVEEIESWELGYRGVFGRRAVVTADYYNSELENFVSTLLPQLGSSLGLINPDFGPYAPPAELPLASQTIVLDALAAALPPEVFAVMSNNFDGSPIFAAASFTNIGRVDTQGVELDLHLFLGDHLRMNAGYTWFDFDVRDLPPENPILPNAPENRAHAGLSYVTPKWDASLLYRRADGYPWLGGIYVGPVPSFGVTDLGANYNVNDNWKLGINVANLFDDRHYEIFGGDLLERRALAHSTVSW